MAEETQFDRFMQTTLTQETRPLPWNKHPDYIDMLDALCGELDPSGQSELSVHVATCERCSARWEFLRESLQSEQRTLNKRANVRDLKSLVKPRGLSQESAGLLGHLMDFWHAFVSRPVAVSVATSALTILVILTGTIPMLRTPLLATSDRLDTLTNTVDAVMTATRATDGKLSWLKDELEGQGDEIAALAESYAGNMTILSAITVSDEPTPAIISQYSWATFQEYTVVSEGTWQSVTEKILGYRELWSLIWFMNQDVGGPDEPLLPGQVIQLPTPTEQ